MALVTFSDLVKREYLAKGFTRKGALAKIHTESGVSAHSVEAAFRGTRVLADTAHELARWCKSVHRCDLDEKALMKAPTKRQLKEAV